MSCVHVCALADYDAPADYWLIEISSQAWGLGNDMLHDGNPWRGMVFGMVTRYGLDDPMDPSNKTQMWKLWDDFKIGELDLDSYIAEDNSNGTPKAAGGGLGVAASGSFESCFSECTFINRIPRGHCGLLQSKG